MVKPIPDGYPVISAYLSIGGAADAIEFYKEVFGAKERMRMDGPGGVVGHAELEFGDSLLMLADETTAEGPGGPRKIGGTPVTICVYVEDVDDVFARALKLGATEVTAVEDKFYGDRSGMFEDPWGHRWNVATHVEDVSGEEAARRAAELMGG